MYAPKRCTGYLVYLFENDEGKGGTESPFLLSEYAEEESPIPHGRACVRKQRSESQRREETSTQ